MSDLFCFLVAFVAFAASALHLESLGLLRRDPALSSPKPPAAPRPSPRAATRRLDVATGFGEARASPTPRPLT